jgi:peptidoglycan/LPS O-acetylase OafA/YrhL
MGYVRLLLAASVFQGHAWAIFPPRVYEFAGGVVSVRLFYMISGFLIALVFHSKYNSAKSFYKSRLLRLLPVYQIVLILSICASALSFFIKKDPFLLGYFSGYQNFLNPFEIMILSVPQLTTLGLDLYGFIGIDQNGLFLAKQSWKYVNGYQFLVVPQAWTLGLECWFYLLAPFIIRSKKSIIILIVFSFFSELIISTSLDFSNDDPWSRRFFPSELKYFLIGALSFKIKSLMTVDSTKYKFAIFAFMIAAISLIDYATIQTYSTFVYLSFFLALPSLLDLSSHLPFDRIIGDLSYPFYLSHWLILNAVDNKIIPSFESPKTLSLIYTILFSIALVLLVERKIDKIRRRYAKHQGNRLSPAQS